MAAVTHIAAAAADAPSTKEGRHVCTKDVLKEGRNICESLGDTSKIVFPQIKFGE